MTQLKGDRARAALVLFKSGFSFKDVARLLAVSRDQVMAVVRRAV
jgi:DNA-directed RNA polymerase specialized sigma24 family protein